MKNLLESDFVRHLPVEPPPSETEWEVVLFAEVKAGHFVSFKAQFYQVKSVSAGEFCGARVYSAKLVRTPMTVREVDPLPGSRLDCRIQPSG